MSERPLPPRRELTRQKLKLHGQPCYLDIGFYADGSVGEFFLVLEKTGAERRWLFDEIARLSSKLLQYGCPLEEIAEGWVGTKGPQAGPVKDHPRIKNCTSVLDLVARHMLIEYCGQDELAHVRKEAL